MGEATRWRNASAGQDTCIDLAHTFDQVRDSKNPDGPRISGNVAELVAAVRAGRITR